MKIANKKKIWEKIALLSKADRSFDIEFWQAQTPGMRFRVTFDMLKELYRLKGRKVDARTFRLQRSVESFKQA